MAVLALTNAKVVLAQADLSGHSNSVELAHEVEELDSTTFGSSGFKTMVGGLHVVQGNVAGFWQAGDGTQPDDRLFADLGVAGIPLTISPAGAAVADTAFLTRVLRPAYTVGAAVGELLAFEANVAGDGTPLVRGQVARNSAVTSTETSTVLTLTAPTAGQAVYASIHVLSVTGTTPSLTVALQGDDASGFPSPATVATSSAITAEGSTWLAGPVGASADSFYRLSFTVSGTSPSFMVVAAIGVA